MGRESRPRPAGSRRRRRRGKRQGARASEGVGRTAAWRGPPARPPAHAGRHRPLLSSSYSDVLTPRGPADSGVPAPCPHHRGARPRGARPAHGREHTLWQGPRRPRVRLRAPPPAAPDRVPQPPSARGRDPTASGCLEPAEIVQVSRPQPATPDPAAGNHRRGPRPSGCPGPIPACPCVALWGAAWPPVALGALNTNCLSSGNYLLAALPNPNSIKPGF